MSKNKPKTYGATSILVESFSTADITLHAENLWCN